MSNGMAETQNRQHHIYYISRMGFERIVYRGLEMGSRAITSHVVWNGSVTFILTLSLWSFHIDSVNAVYGAAIKSDVKIVSNIKILKDEYGQVKVATIQTYSEMIHTLVKRSRYKGIFLSGYSRDWFKETYFSNSARSGSAEHRSLCRKPRLRWDEEGLWIVDVLISWTAWQLQDEMELSNSFFFLVMNVFWASIDSD